MHVFTKQELMRMGYSEEGALAFLEGRKTPPSPPSIFSTFFSPPLSPALASSHQHKTQREVREIEEEITLLPLEDSFVYDRAKLFFLTGFKILINPLPKVRHLIDYLQGTARLEKIQLNHENAREFLKLVKLVDYALTWQGHLSSQKFKLKRTSYKIRTFILKLCSPQMNTCEAYTKTLLSSRMEDFPYLQDPSHWVAKRKGLYAKLIANASIRTLALSKRLHPKAPSIWAVRGNSGSGKTYYLAHDRSLQHALDEKGSLSGSLNPDTFKACLKRISPFTPPHLVNNQVHEEGAALFARYQQALSQEALKLSLILDTRLLYVEDLKAHVIEPTRKRGGKAYLIDMDAPLLTSIHRMLIRDPFGKDPCVVLEAVIQGAVRMRENRLSIIEEVKKESLIKRYQLYHSGATGSTQLVAEKKKGTFKILMKESFKECVRPPSKEEIQQQIQQIISTEHIDLAIARLDIPCHQRPLLEKWKGKTIEEAMQKHAGMIHDQSPAIEAGALN